MQRLDQRAIAKCNSDWKPKTFNPQMSLSPGSSNYGRTTILPAMFDDHSSVVMDTTGGGGFPVGTWRQLFTTSGHQMIIQGRGTGETIPENFKVAWAGLAFPNKEQHITEFRYQIGDRKYGRINIEEMQCYDTPAIIFDEGYILDEEESFHLYAYVEGPIPTAHDAHIGMYQRIVMLGASYFNVVSKILGVPCTQIP